MYYWPVVVFLLKLLTVFEAILAEESVVHLMSFLSMTGKVWRGGQVVLPSLDMALNDVNDRTDILTNYKLNMSWKDTKCDAGVSTNALYELLYTPPVKHMIIGPTCSSEAEVQAQASHVWNVSHFTYAATSPILRDKMRFPRFFRVLAPDTRFNLARLALFEHFNWQKVATISVAQNIFSAVTDDIVQHMRQRNMTIITEEIFSNDPFLRVQNLKKKDARIIVSGSYENHARLILCAAYKVGLYGPKIVWFFPGWYIDYWWRMDLDNVPCTQEQMDIAAEGHFLTGIYYRNTEEERGIAGITPTEFYERLRQNPNYKTSSSMYDFIAPAAYDTLWGSALALNCTDRVLREKGHAKTLDQFEYSDGDIGDIMTSCIDNVSFLGLTGWIRFDRNGEPLKNIKIVQIRNLQKVTVGTYVLEDYNWHIEWHGEGIKWRGGMVPRDSTLVTLIEMTIPLSLYAPMAFFAALGILLALSFLVFNIIYRNHVYVKLSSPSINNVLLLGCIISYCTVFLYSYTGITKVLCKMRHVMLTTGFTMSFGAMFSKTWRVYKIFCNKRPQRVKIQDFQLIGMVIILLAIMSTILVVWEIVDPLFIRTLKLENQMYFEANDAIVVPFLRDCMSENYYYFLWTICIVEGVLLAFGAFLSFETRRVKIEALNDSRHIGMCLYNVVVLSSCLLILSILLDDKVALMFGVYSGFVIVGTTATMLIIFVPKILSVFYPQASDTVAPSTRIGNIKATTSSIIEPAESTANKSAVYTG